ncbi:TORTIFOLIA1-like protein 2 [Cryptomeria japonica]|uniref:TORTIFOLIA1-like protein 2 n=1 Tax=Cryptomeria japonica TaxID=3369 RepID=UPI0025ACCB23|nr:TORTIFOLIA1-like protein 2 [Cryptomeria japonica]
MAQVRSNRASIGKPSPQQAIHELKQRTIVAINKLSDRDTYQIAAQELHGVAQSLSPDALSPFLTCLCDTDSRQKSIVRKECVKLFATLADAHGDILTSHLSKMVANIVRRLKDPDSNVRDACVDSIGVMASKITTPSIAVFIRPLFECLGEQNRYLQVGSAMCLARVIDHAADPQPAGLQRLLPRIVKLLNNKIFLGKPALLCVIGSIVEAGGASNQHTLSMLIPAMDDALRSSDWATRKAAAEAFSRMALNIADLVTPFKSSCLASLESSRFDKVKPVRDMVNQALQSWKSIPDSDESLPSHEREPSAKENMYEDHFSIAFKPSNSFKPDCGSVKKSSIAVSRSPPDTVSVSSIRKRSPLTDKKTNPALLHKQGQKNVDSWQVEVAVPQSRPVEDHDKSYSKSLFAKLKERRDSNVDHGTRFKDSEIVEKLDTPRRSDCDTKCVVIDRPFDLKPAVETVPNEKQNTSNAGRNSFKIQCNGHDLNELAMIRKQLVQIENQQSSLLELMKMFMGSSQEGLHSLEKRVHGLERTVDEMAQDLAVSTGRLSTVEDGRATCCKFPGSVLLSSKFWRKNEGRYSPAQLATSDGSSMSRSGRGAPYRAEMGTDIWDRKLKGLRGGFMVNPLADVRGTLKRETTEFVSNDTQRSILENLEGNQMFTKARDRNRSNEGPSVSSALQVSEDEAIAFSGMRVVGKDAKTEVCDSVKENSRPTAIGRTTDFNSKLGQGSGSFWSVWSRSVEFLWKGDVESAFGEVLCIGDDLLLIRLMNRTGPVLEHLSQGTILEMMQALKQFLLKQKFLGSVIPWIQQVVDLTASNGSDYLGLSLDAKKEMLQALQEASSKHFSDSSNRNTIAQSASKLSTLWMVDSLKCR